MSVPMLDLKRQYQPLAAEIMPILEGICATQQFILGRYVLEFEQAAARYCQCAHTVGVSSGTDALLLALMTLGVGAGDEVITTPFTFFATAGTIARAGARPVFCDIEARSFNLDPAAVRDFLQRHCERRAGRLINRDSGARVRALMPVHLYGQCADMAVLLDLAREFDLKVIEDAAQAIGADYLDGRRAGSMGEIGCLSFFPTKNLGAFGDAGMCTTQDAELAERMRVLRVHGAKPKYYHALIGGNFRLDEIQAAVLAVKLRLLDGWTAARARNAACYEAAFARSGLGERIEPPAATAGYRHTWNQYVIRAPRRDELRQFLGEHGVGTEIYYPVPLHRQQCFAYLGHGADDFPVAEAAAREVLALPIFPELEPQQIEYVVDRIAAFYD
ncbi:MAG: DegT/DnrJ/EryC1/StrS family aminotransferase [Steroidobacterales bacterium]